MDLPVQSSCESVVCSPDCDAADLLDQVMPPDGLKTCWRVEFHVVCGPDTMLRIFSIK